MGCLAHFRAIPLPGFDELEETFGPSFPRGAVPSDWCVHRTSQSAKVSGIFADVAHSNWLAWLQQQAPKSLLQQMEGPIDQATVYQAKFRPVTQWIARQVFAGEENCAGLYYSCRHGSELANWAIFEGRATVLPEGPTVPIAGDDADLLTACNHLHVRPPLRFISSQTF